MGRHPELKGQGPFPVDPAKIELDWPVYVDVSRIPPPEKEPPRPPPPKPGIGREPPENDLGLEGLPGL